MAKTGIQMVKLHIFFLALKINSSLIYCTSVIPDYSKMQWLARAPTFPELEVLVERVQNCLK